MLHCCIIPQRPAVAEGFTQPRGSGAHDTHPETNPVWVVPPVLLWRSLASNPCPPSVAFGSSVTARRCLPSLFKCSLALGAAWRCAPLLFLCFSCPRRALRVVRAGWARRGFIVLHGPGFPGSRWEPPFGDGRSRAGPAVLSPMWEALGVCCARGGLLDLRHFPHIVGWAGLEVRLRVSSGHLGV